MAERVPLDQDEQPMELRLVWHALAMAGCLTIFLAALGLAIMVSFVWLALVIARTVV